MSSLSFKTYLVKAEHLFWLMPFEGVKYFDTKSTIEKSIWFHSLQNKLLEETASISKTYDDLLKNNPKSQYDLEFSTITDLMKKSFQSYTDFLWQKEVEKYMKIKELVKGPNDLKQEDIFDNRKRQVIFQHLVNKHSKALIEDLKKVAKIQPPKVKKLVISKLSDISIFLEQFKLSNHFKDLEEKALNIKLKNNQLQHNDVNLLKIVLNTYDSQIPKLLSEQQNILETVRNLRLDPRKEKVYDDFINFIDIVYRLIQSNSEENLLLEDNMSTATGEEILILGQKNIKLRRNLRRKIVHFYNSFSKFTN